MKGRTLALLFLVLAVVAAGCGDNAETKAVKALNKAQDDAGAQVLAHAGDVNGASSADDASRGLADQAAQLRDMADKFDHAEVPSKADAQRDSVVAQLRTASTLVTNWRNNPTFHQDIKTTGQRIKVSIAALNREMGR